MHGRFAANNPILKCEATGSLSGDDGHRWSRRACDRRLQTPHHEMGDELSEADGIVQLRAFCQETVAQEQFGVVAQERIVFVALETLVQFAQQRMRRVQLQNPALFRGIEIPLTQQALQVRTVVVLRAHQTGG